MDPGHSALYALLDERNAQPDQAARAAIDARIRQRFGATRAVMIGDMSGFSRQTQDRGILHFLAVIRRMHCLLRPVIERHGQLTKWEADNLYASFSDSTSAIQAALDCQEACREYNRTVSDAWQIVMSFGIGYGQVLDLDGSDFYGDEVNLASKLGEDVAGKGQLLITQSAADNAVLPGGWFLREHTVRVSRLDLPYYSLERTE